MVARSDRPFFLRILRLHVVSGNFKAFSLKRCILSLMRSQFFLKINCRSFESRRKMKTKLLQISLSHCCRKKHWKKKRNYAWHPISWEENAFILIHLASCQRFNESIRFSFSQFGMRFSYKAHALQTNSEWKIGSLAHFVPYKCIRTESVNHSQLDSIFV